MTVSAVVVSDTHMPRRGRELSKELLRAAAEADIIFHLGDFVDLSVVELFAGMGRFEAVHGNVDSREVQAMLPARKVLDIEERRIVLIHGHLGGRTALEAARAQKDADVVMFGHSHQPYDRAENGRLLLNPGSPTEKRLAPYKSFARLSIGETVTAEIIPVP